MSGMQTLNTVFTGVMLGLVMAISGAARAQPAPVLSAEDVTPLEAGKWYTAAEISAHVQAAVHQPVADMNFELDDGLFAGVVTATADGSRWYILQGNAILGDSTHYRLIFTGTALLVSDVRRIARPVFSQKPYDRNRYEDDAQALSTAVERPLSTRFYEDAVTNAMQAFDQRIAMQGRTVGGQLLTLMADPSNEGDFRLLLTWDGGGVTVANAQGRDFEFSSLRIAEFDNAVTAREQQPAATGQPTAAAADGAQQALISDGQEPLVPDETRSGDGRDALQLNVRTAAADIPDQQGKLFSAELEYYLGVSEPDLARLGLTLAEFLARNNRDAGISAGITQAWQSAVSGFTVETIMNATGDDFTEAFYQAVFEALADFFSAFEADSGVTIDIEVMGANIYEYR